MAVHPLSGLAEGEDVRAHARLVECDLEGALGGAGAVADELVHPRLIDSALAELIDVEAVVEPGRLTVEEHGEADRGARGRRREDKVEVARLETERDRAVRRVEDGRLLLDGPVPGHPPLIERQVRGRVDAANPAAVADVGLPRPQPFPVSGLGETVGFNTHGLLVDAQELLDRSLGRLVVALTEVAVADPAVAVNDGHGGAGAGRLRMSAGEDAVDGDTVAVHPPAGFPT